MCIFFFYRVLLCVTFILVYDMSVALPFACYVQINTVRIGITSYGSLGNVPPPELARVHQSGNFYLRTTPVGGGRLLVNSHRFEVI